MAQGFTEEERAQLYDIFGVPDDHLDMLLSVSAFIFEQAAYAMTTPSTLGNELMDAGVSEHAAGAFASVWAQGASERVAALKEASVLTPIELKALDWQLRVATSTSDAGKQGAETAHAVLELQLSQSAPSGEEDAQKSLHVSFGQRAMTNLLTKLDTIQTQMDRLQGHK